jgi:hypothetical protein
MNHLTTLLHDASTDGPTDHLDLDDLLGTARSRVRRRRAVGGLALAAVVGAAAGLTLVGPGGEGEQAPAAPPQVQVLTLEDAEQAEPGQDFQVLDTFTAHSTDEAMTGDFVRGVLADGTVVLQRYPDGPDGPTQVVLVGAEDTQVVEAPTGLGNFLGATDQELVFGGDADGLLLLDRERLVVRGVLDRRLLDSNHAAQPVSDGDGHLYVAGAPMGSESARPLFDVDVDAGRATELARGGHVAAYGGRVAWTDAYDAPVRAVTVRDAQGGTTDFDPHTGDCIGKGVGVTGTRVVLMTNCDDGAGDSEYTDVVNRIDVFDLDGTPVSRITGDELGPVRMTDRYLTITSWDDETAGTYTYDVETGGFLRVTDAMSGLAGSETGHGSTLVWEERLDGDAGATYVVARMR